MEIMDGINFGIGLWLSLPVLAVAMVLGLTGVGLIMFPFVYGYKKLINKKDKSIRKV